MNKELKINVPSSFVAKPHKFEKENGSGEAKLYVGNLNDTTKEFFNGMQTGGNKKIIIRNESLIQYFKESSAEYLSNVYKNVSNEAFLKNVNYISSLDINQSISITFEYQADKHRLYLAFSKEDESYNIMTKLRNILFPKKTNLILIKDDNNPNTFYMKFEFSNQNTEENLNTEQKSKQLKKAENVIFYGAPGTGKSHNLVKYLNENDETYTYTEENIKTAKNVFRVTLHPEYEYSDFVGQLMPQKEGNFAYNSGVFTDSFKYAISNPNKPTFMILEEMSRANVAAVFGDIFQLLDRDKEGKSDYAINNKMLAEIIYGLKDEEAAEKSIEIPSNLYIIGTVNTNDQNVFVMDTAFKRRFKWKYKSTLLKLKEKDFDNNSNIELFTGHNVSWYKFYNKLNEYITEDLKLSEDKQIGPYFIKFTDGMTPKESHDLFRDKLLQYLWEDIDNLVKNSFTSTETIFSSEIKSFSKLYDTFDAEGNVFSKTLLDKLDIKVEENTNNQKDEGQNDDETTEN